MTAIQRWYIMDPYDAERDPAPSAAPLNTEMLLRFKWCKANDVAELERILAKSLERTTRARADRTISDDLVKSLRAEIIEKDIEIVRLKEYEWMYKDLCN